MRSAIFIDGGYLLNQLADANVTPDYRRLAEHLLAPLRRQTTLDLMRCYFYYCPPWMSDKPTEGELRRMAEHQKFAAEIEGNDRWQLRLGKLERRREGDKQVFAQKRVDVQLSVDLVHHAAAGHIQHAIVVAGDSDFIPAIVAAKESGATVTLWCDNDKSVHRDLLAEVDEVHFINWKTFPQVKEGEAPEREPRPSSRPPREASAQRPPRERSPRPASDQAARPPRDPAARPPRDQAARAPRDQASRSSSSSSSRAQPPVIEALELPAEVEPSQAAALVEAAAGDEKKPGRRRRRGGRGRRGKGTGPAAGES